METVVLIGALQAGATLVGSEVVKEITKDCYKALKTKVSDIFGRRVGRSLEQLEASPADSLPVTQLTEIIGPVSAEDGAEIHPLLVQLLQAIKADERASYLVQTTAHIKLDVDAVGNVTLDRIEGAQNMDVKAKAGGDFSMTNISMARGTDQGN